MVGRATSWGATVPEGNSRPLIFLTTAPVAAVLVSQTFRSICVPGGFSGSKWFRPGCALNHAGSDRWPLSTARNSPVSPLTPPRLLTALLRKGDRSARLQTSAIAVLQVVERARSAGGPQFPVGRTSTPFGNAFWDFPDGSHISDRQFQKGFARKDEPAQSSFVRPRSFLEADRCDFAVSRRTLEPSVGRLGRRVFGTT